MLLSIPWTDSPFDRWRFRNWIAGFGCELDADGRDGGRKGKGGEEEEYGVLLVMEMEAEDDWEETERKIMGFTSLVRKSESLAEQAVGLTAGPAFKNGG
jgi:hypothetical protein